MLTIFDEGGAVAVCDERAEELVRGARWKELFLESHRELRIVVLGHAVLEQALAPYPGMTCKVIFARAGRGLDAHCAEWLATRGQSPRDLPPLPIMGYPGWYPGNGVAGFYDDVRTFRGAAYGRAVESRPGAGQAVAVPQGAEESPGSEEQDAG